MIGEERDMVGTKPAEFYLGAQSELRADSRGYLRSEDRRAAIVESHQMTVKERVEVSSEQKAIEDVEPLGVAGAFGPRLRMAGAKEFGDGDIGDRARIVPVFHEAFAIDVLTHTLANKPLDFGG